jgi:hypothetical protein
MKGYIIQISENKDCPKVIPEQIVWSGTDFSYVSPGPCDERIRDKFCKTFAQQTDGVLDYKRGVFTYNGGARELMKDRLQDLMGLIENKAKEDLYYVYWKIRRFADYPVHDGVLFLLNEANVCTQVDLLDTLTQCDKGQRLHVIDIFEYEV